MVKNQRNYLAIFGPFWTFEFFKNRGLSFETSDSDFRDLLDELFHMSEKNRKNQMAGLDLDRSYFKVPYYMGHIKPDNYIL